MTPAEFHDARLALGLTVEGLARLLHVAGRTIRRWEDGSRHVPPTVVVLMRLFRNPEILAVAAEI